MMTGYEKSIQSIQNSPVSTTGMVSRLYFVDYLRAALVILVVLHHVAMVYGGIPPFYYLEPPVNDPLAGLALLVFLLFNQAWFMGALFLLAGYFTPGSFDRKGPGTFLKDRLFRLGIPLFIWIFVLNPISSIGFFLMPASLTGNTTPLTWQVYPYLLGLGPLWFLAMLLIFSFGYAACRMVATDRTGFLMSDSSAPGYFRIGVFIVALAGISYLVRIIIPIGKEMFGFPTLAYLPQYLSFFIVGIVASRQNRFQTLPNSLGVTGAVLAVMAAIVLFPIAFISLLVAIENALPQLPPFGYGTWQSAVYALWDSVFAVGMILFLIPLFRRFFNGQGRLGRFLSQHSYTVYIIHIPIIVFVAYALREIELPALLKFGVVVVMVVPICFAVAYIVRKIPFAYKVL